MKVFGIERPGALDSLLLAALRMNPLEVVSVASSELSNWWLAAHLADLLQHREALHTAPELAPHTLPDLKILSLSDRYGSKLTEFLIIEYASSLLAHPRYTH